MLQTSYEAKTKDVWVFIETKDGKARNVGLELLNPGRRLAGIQGGKAVALVIGHAKRRIQQAGGVVVGREDIQQAKLRQFTGRHVAGV